jgi:hypothetical protein
MLEAKATLTRFGRNYTWQVTRCPYDPSHGHFHGGGLVGGDPDKLLGYRSGHGNCGGYILVRDPDGDHCEVEMIDAISEIRPN